MLKEYDILEIGLGDVIVGAILAIGWLITFAIGGNELFRLNIIGSLVPLSYSGLFFFVFILYANTNLWFKEEIK